MKTNVSSLGQGPGLAWKRSTSSFPPGSLAEFQEWTGGKTEPPWHGDLDFQQWNTIGCAITDDGILCVKPWEGSAGETGPVTTGKDIPWYNQRSKIRKIESIGTIVLNANSVGLFYGCSFLTDLTGLANWNVSEVTNTRGMFGGCSSLTDLSALANWDVSNGTNMSGMFYRCSSLTDMSALANWNVSKVTDMSSMFYGCSNLTDLDALAGWDVSKVTNMSSMFYGCSNLTDLDAIKDWNASNVTNMGFMFQNCSNLTDLSGLANWDVSKVTNMSNMFAGCSNLQKIGIPSIANGGQNLVEKAEGAALTTVLPSIVAEDGSMGPFTWDELFNEMTPNPDAFQEGTVWVRANEEAEQ